MEQVAVERLNLDAVRGLTLAHGVTLHRRSFYVADAYTPTILAGPFTTARDAIAELRRINIDGDCFVVFNTP